MKLIPTKDLVILLQMSGREIYSKDMLSELLDNYGDDYYASQDNRSELELTKTNELREFIMSCKEGEC